MNIKKRRDKFNLTILSLAVIFTLFFSLFILSDSLNNTNTPTGFSVFSDIYNAVTSKSSPSLGPIESDVSKQEICNAPVGSKCLYIFKNSICTDTSGNLCDGSDWAHAWKELNQINWTKVGASDIIKISGGSSGVNYTSSVTISKSGDPVNRLRIERATENGHNGKVILKGGFIITGSYITLDGIDKNLFEFYNPGTTYLYINTNNNEDYFQVKNVFVRNTPDPSCWSRSIDVVSGSLSIDYSELFRSQCSEDIIRFQSHGRLKIEHSYIHEWESLYVPGMGRGTLPPCPIDPISDSLCWSHSDMVEGGSTGHSMLSLIFKNNLVDDEVIATNSRSGGNIVLMTGYTAWGDVEVSNNVFKGVYQVLQGISFSSLKASNNVFYNTHDANFGGSNNIYDSDYQVVWQGANYSIWSPRTPSFVTATGNFVGDPGFNNPSSILGSDNVPFTSDDGFSLKSGSLAINRGTAVTGRTSDILGNSIIGTPDLGAYEFGSSSPASEKKQVILIGVDGVQVAHIKEMIADNRLPNFVRLGQNGGFMGNATITGHSSTETAPGNSELHTGLPASVTGVSSNTCDVTIVANLTTFERLRKYNPNIALGLVYGKSTCYIPDSILKNAKPIVSWWHNRTTYSQDQYISANYADSRNVSTKSFEFLNLYKNDSFYLVVYYGAPDGAGHAYGENTVQYNNSLINVDLALGMLLDYLSQNNINAQVILSADHGWNEGTTGHGTNAYDTVTIPLFSNNYTLVSKIYSQSLRKQCDIAPTILNYFNVNSSLYSDINTNGCGSLINNLPIINGQCGLTLDSCSAGNYINITDNSTDYIWSCIGQNGGTDKNCSYIKPIVYPVVSGSNISINQFGSYLFNITSAGNYRLVGNVNAPSDSANSFFINIDSDPGNDDILGNQYIWDILPLTIGYQQRNISLRGINGNFTYSEFNPKNWSLSAGMHTLYINQRTSESGTQINSIQFIKLDSSSNQYHPADLNTDLAVSLNEFTNYSSYFKLGKNWPIAPSPPDANYYSRAYFLLKRGLAVQGAYSYNSSSSCPSCFIIR